MRKISILLCLVLLVTFLAAGCKDISDSYKPGSFGGSAKEKEMVAALTNKHGDLREGGQPRFLEAMMTTKVDNGMPVDQVSKYSKSTKQLMVWFVYDNFNEDQIDIEWIYLPQNYSIHTFKAQTGKDFGRGTFILEQPNDGWPMGAYKVIIRGRGVESTVNFEIIDGQTVSVPIMAPSGKIELPKLPGWYLTNWEYIKNTIDITNHQPHGYHSSSVMMGTSSKLYDYAKGTGDKNDFTVAFWRTGSDGKQLAGSTSHTTWEDPPSFIKEGEKVSLRVGRSYDNNNTWGQNGLNIKFDSNDLSGASFATAGRIAFVDDKGQTRWHSYSGTVTSEKGIPKGRQGDLRAIWIYLEGYSYKYTYEWRD